MSYEVTADLNQELVEKAISRFNLQVLKEQTACGFRHHEGVFVAELIRGKVTDKLEHYEAELILNVYRLDEHTKEKVTLNPKLPGEKRARRLMLPKRNLEVTRSFQVEIPKEQTDADT